MKEIIVTINEETGESTIEAKGYVGKECIKGTAPFVQAIGGTEKRELKREYNQVAPANKQKT